MNPYLEASKKIAAADGYSCSAIEHLNWNCEHYAKLFCPEGSNHFGFWLDYAMEKGLLEWTERHDWRLTALCLAAAMYESEDLD